MSENVDASRETDALFEHTVGVDAPGASAIVVQNGKILHRRGYGLANLEHNVPNAPETIFRLGSVTKTFTATAILQLSDRGLLGIDDPISKHLVNTSHGSQITIQHLLTHTSGMGVDENAPLEFAPGERMDYSNAGYMLLGRVIESVSGRSYEEYLRTNIFEPLNMAKMDMITAARFSSTARPAAPSMRMVRTSMRPISTCRDPMLLGGCIPR